MRKQEQGAITITCARQAHSCSAIPISTCETFSLLFPEPTHIDVIFFKDNPNCGRSSPHCSHAEPTSEQRSQLSKPSTYPSRSPWQTHRRRETSVRRHSRLRSNRPMLDLHFTRLRPHPHYRCPGSSPNPCRPLLHNRISKTVSRQITQKRVYHRHQVHSSRTQSRPYNARNPLLTSCSMRKERSKRERLQVLVPRHSLYGRKTPRFNRLGHTMGLGVYFTAARLRSIISLGAASTLERRCS